MRLCDQCFQRFSLDQGCKKYERRGRRIAQHLRVVLSPFWRLEFLGVKYIFKKITHPWPRRRKEKLHAISWFEIEYESVALIKWMW
jgi:hypothetical protein